MVGTRSDVSISRDASGKCKKGRRRLEETPEKPPAIERRRKSRLAGGGTNSNDSSPSVLENLILVANRTRTRTGETNCDNRMNNNADDEDVSPRGRMGHETSREDRIDDNVSDDDLLQQETTDPETNNRCENRMNNIAKELPRGMVHHETSDTDELRRGTMGPETSNRRRDNRMNDSASELRRRMVHRETNYQRANRMSDLGDKEEELRRGMVRRETNRRDNRMNNNVDDEISDSDDSHMFEQGTNVNDYNGVVDRQAAMRRRRQNEQEAGLMLHKKNAKFKTVYKRP